MISIEKRVGENTCNSDRDLQSHNGPPDSKEGTPKLASQVAARDESCDESAMLTTSARGLVPSETAESVASCQDADDTWPTGAKQFGEPPKVAQPPTTINIGPEQEAEKNSRFGQEGEFCRGAKLELAAPEKPEPASCWAGGERAGLLLDVAATDDEPSGGIKAEPPATAPEINHCNGKRKQLARKLKLNCHIAQEDSGAQQSTSANNQLTAAPAATSLFAHVDKVKRELHEMLTKTPDHFAPTYILNDDVYSAYQSQQERLVCLEQQQQQLIHRVAGGPPSSRRLSSSLRSDGGSTSSLTPQPTKSEGEEEEQDLEQECERLSFLPVNRLAAYQSRLLMEEREYQQQQQQSESLQADRERAEALASLQQLMRKRDELRSMDKQLFNMMKQYIVQLESSPHRIPASPPTMGQWGQARESPPAAINHAPNISPPPALQQAPRAPATQAQEGPSSSDPIDLSISKLPPAASKWSRSVNLKKLRLLSSLDQEQEEQEAGRPEVGAPQAKRFCGSQQQQISTAPAICDQAAAMRMAGSFVAANQPLVAFHHQLNSNHQLAASSSSFGVSFQHNQPPQLPVAAQTYQDYSYFPMAGIPMASAGPQTPSAAAAAAAATAAAVAAIQKSSAFRCHVCGSGFEDRHRLQQHLSIHLNLHPSWFEEMTIKETMAQYEAKRGDYLCQSCNLRFETTAEFDKHMQLHSDKPHRCDLCNQDNKFISFRYYRQLLTHLRSHCFLYSCKFASDCKQTANRKDYLKLHILKHHLNNILPEQYTICCQ